MNPSPSYPFDADLHDDDTVAGRGRCSHHGSGDERAGECTGEAVVSFRDRDGSWQAGCSLALEQLVERGEIEPLGQGG
jgi:hypothetical protein